MGVWLRQAVWLFAFAAAQAVFGAAMDGDLTVVVRDPAGLAVEADVRVVSRTAQVDVQARSDAEGRARFRRLLIGAYTVDVRRPGFQEHSERVEISSAIPVVVEIVLTLETAESVVEVQAAPPVLDPSDPAMALHVGRQTLEETRLGPLGRGVIGHINELPGWLLEANAVLHPRGSEYDTQYVIDGVPVYDNRSIAFVPAFEVDEFEAVNVMTAGIPAEFGRRLGGVIELFPRRTSQLGWRTNLDLSGGTFETFGGALSEHYQGERTGWSAGVRAGRTDRYLDPPSLENFTNKGSSAGAYVRLDRDIGASDRLSVYARRNRVGFLVPNDLEQQEAGQRQDRRGEETTAQAHYQRVFSASRTASLRGMVREVEADLWSNPLATPVYLNQDRGIREGVVSGAYTWLAEIHQVKLGGDFRSVSIRERFSFSESVADPLFQFRESARSSEGGLFVQDQIRLGALSLNAGLRFDGYDLLVRDSGLSPRLAASYYWDAADLLFRAAYDRVFQTPPLENLLLSSTEGVFGLEGVDEVVPVPASWANFFEVGVRKAFGDAARLDVTRYWRRFDNYFDDDVLLNTGIGFPLTFDAARIAGTEVRLALPSRWGVTSMLSYSNMHGTAASPVTGGLFIEGGEAEDLRDVAVRFPITQDQRNTAAGRLRYEPHPRVWFAVAARYGSGLPIELEDDDDDEPEDDESAEIPDEILRRVNFSRGRIRPNFSLDLSVGIRVWRDGSRRADLQVDATNVTDRLNVINFSSLFSGTAIAPTRMIGVKLRLAL